METKSNFWEIKQSMKSKTIDIYFYSDIEPDEQNFWGDTVYSETSAKSFARQLEEAGDIDQINLFINSKGGAVAEGVAIYNQLIRHTAKKTAYIDGVAASVASVIPMACDTVLIGRNANMMLHYPWMYVCGNAKQLRQYADALDVLGKSSKQAYLMKAGDKLTEEQLSTFMDNEKWLTADDCIEYGLADGYINAEDEKDDSQLKSALQILREAELSAQSRLGKLPADPPPDGQKKDTKQQTQETKKAEMLIRAAIQAL